MCLLVVGVCGAHGRNREEVDEAERGGTMMSNGEGGIITVGRHASVLCVSYFLSNIYLPYFLNLLAHP